MARNSRPSFVVSTTVMNSCRLENEACRPSSSAIRSRTWYIQITNTNSVTKAIQPISLRERIADQIAPKETGSPRLAATADLVEADRHEWPDQREAGRKGIDEIDHAEGGEAEHDGDAAGCVERAEAEPIKRQRLEIAQTLDQRLGDVGRRNGTHHRIDFARDGHRLPLLITGTISVARDPILAPCDRRARATLIADDGIPGGPTPARQGLAGELPGTHP